MFKIIRNIVFIFFMSVICFSAYGLVKEADLIEKYRPYLILDKEEEYYPMAVDDYFLNPSVKLVYDKGHTSSDYKFLGRKSVSDGEVIFQGSSLCGDAKDTCISMEKIYNFDKYSGRELFFIFDNDQVYKGNRDLSKVPIYAVLKKIEREGSVEYQIQYLTFFGFNGAYKIGKIPFVNDLSLIDANAHEADLEHMTVIVNVDKVTEAERLDKVYYGSHGTKEGVWLDAQSIKFFPGTTRPISYVAKGGHGNYQNIGEWVRIFGFANDLTREGKHWDPEVIRVYEEGEDGFDPKTMGWLYHNGALGPRGVSAPVDQAWFNKSEVGDLGSFTTHKYANFCPIPKKKLWLGVFRFSPISRLTDCASKAAGWQVLRGRGAVP
jgi:hypothetical protein